MNLPAALQPKRQQWFVATSAIAGVSLVLAAGVQWWRGWSAGDWWGLTFGTLAALLMVVAALYPLRRRLMIWPLRTAQDWLQLHLYGGTLAAVFVLIHTGFKWPGGQFGWWLLLLTLWTTASGLAGVVLQKWVPTRLATQLTVEVIYERVPGMIASLQAEAGRTMEGASDVLQRFYDAQVQPALAGLSPSWSYLFDIRAGRDRQLASFDHIQTFMDEADKGRLADLKTLVSEKLQIEAHYTLQRVLRLWPLLHVPPAMLLLALIVAHVAAVWYF